MKCILCYSVLDENGIVSSIPFSTKGRKGHDLIQLMNNLIIELNNHNYSKISSLTNSDMDLLINNNELKEIIEKVYGTSKGRIHPATRTFQSLRILMHISYDFTFISH